jgi:NosR/NirI family nitrous oxide reductase transcriptional regulator
LVGLFFLSVMGLFIAQRKLTERQSRLSTVHLGVLAISVVVVGFSFRAQPSITQLLTLGDGLLTGLRWELYLSEPTLFVSWLGILAVTVVWGRGVFCGWICPFGALSEVLFRLGQRLGLPKIELPDAVHRRARLVRYGLLLTLFVSFWWSAELGEFLAEVEPFKTTFLVVPWIRHWVFFGWWALLLTLSLFWLRPFCRYLCPLGAALALPTRWSWQELPRRMACKTCRICRRGCQYRAFRPDGGINPYECLSCLECEVHYQDPEVCPPLVGIAAISRITGELNRSTLKKRLDRLQEKKEEWI